MRNISSEMTSSTTMGALFAFALALLFMATSASAQPHPNGKDVDALPSPEPVAAMPMTAAEVDVSNWDDLGDRRSRHAEELQPWEHGERASALWSAAHLHLYTGEELRALRELESAGEAALNAGRVYLAASAYLRAAYVANDLARVEKARSLLDRAEELRSSPRLSDAQREQLAVEVDRPLRFSPGAY